LLFEIIKIFLTALMESVLTISRPFLISIGTVLTLLFITSDVLSIVFLKYEQYLVFAITMILLNIMATIVFLIATLVLVVQERRHRTDIRNNSSLYMIPNISQEEWVSDWI